AMSRPLAISTNGVSVSTPVRAPLSRMPMAASAVKPRASRIPQPSPGGRPSAARGAALPTPSLASTIAAAAARTSPIAPPLAPADAGGAELDARRGRPLPDTAGEVARAERGAPAPRLERLRHQRRRQRMLHAGGETSHQEHRHQREVASREADDEEAQCGQRR